MNKKNVSRILAAALWLMMLAALCPTFAMAAEVGENLVFNNGTMDGILADGETE